MSTQAAEPDTFTAQDVVDALRLALIPDLPGDEVLRIVQVILDRAPETDRTGGAGLLIQLISEAKLEAVLT